MEVPRYALSAALKKISGKHSSSLFRNMREDNETVGSLALRTNLTLEQVKRTVFGKTPPINLRGNWTREAVLISEALEIEPRALFSDVLAEVRDAFRVSLYRAPEVFRLPAEQYLPDEVDLSR